MPPVRRPAFGDGQLEKFLRGEPLTESLAAVREGRFDYEPANDEQPAPAEPTDLDDPDRELTRSERLDLRNLKTGAGWLVVTRLIKRALRRREANAIVISQNDPLKNSEAIAREWAYVALWKRVYLELQAGVDSEVALLKDRQKKEAETGE